MVMLATSEVSGTRFFQCGTLARWQFFFFFNSNLFAMRTKLGQLDIRSAKPETFRHAVEHLLGHRNRGLKTGSYGSPRFSGMNSWCLSVVDMDTESCQELRLLSESIML